MRKIYSIDQFQQVHNELYFSLNENQKGIQIQPAGQVLVDSDNFAFIYLVEEDGGYSYLSFPQAVWPQLVELLKNNRNPILQIDGNTIELEKFNEELQMLLFNIEGNDNYGGDFVRLVEESFADFL